MLSRIFLSIYATVGMNTDLDPVGTAVPGEIPGEKAVDVYVPLSLNCEF